MSASPRHDLTDQLPRQAQLQWGITAKVQDPDDDDRSPSSPSVDHATPEQPYYLVGSRSTKPSINAVTSSGRSCAHNARKAPLTVSPEVKSRSSPICSKMT